MTIQNLSFSDSVINAAVRQFHHDDQSLGALFDKQPVENFEPGESVFFEDDPTKHIFEVVEGVLRLCKILVDGRRVICGFLFAGDIVGVSQQHRFNYGAEAVNAVKIRRVNRRALEDAIERSPRMRPQVFSRMCDEMNALQQQMVLLSCKSAEERVCSFLAKLMKRQAIPGEHPILIDLPMTRLDMADYLGLTIETVSRNLTKLAKKGVLADVDRFSLRVVKPNLLNELAGIWSEDEDEHVPATPRLSRH